MSNKAADQEYRDLNQDPQSVAAWIAQSLKNRGIDRIFGLQGGHIQPIWDHVAQLGIRIIDVRDERAAVHMAHAHAELTGTIGIAMATAGPGVTNTITGVANAHLARVPVVVIGGCTSRPQVNMGPLQDIAHTAIMRPVTRFAETARVPEQALRELDAAFAHAMGQMGDPGPAYIEFPTDVLRSRVQPQLVLDEWLRPANHGAAVPDPTAIDLAVEALRQARRPLVISGRGAQGSAAALRRFLDVSKALYLDTQESRGLVPATHDSVVAAMRGAVMGEADLVVTVGRKLDYQLAYGSPAVFGAARFLRISDAPGELIDNRRGSPEILADVSTTLTCLADALGNDPGARDDGWLTGMRKKHLERASQARVKGVPLTGADGKIHPLAIFEAIGDVADRTHIGIADGGDLLSFARVGLQSNTYLDAGAFGCLGVGVPFAVAASLAFPDRQVISVNGDGAFGLNAMEIDTAVRHGATPLWIVSNNAAWNIERLDQELNYGGRVVGTTLQHSDYAGLARSLGAHGERVEDPTDLKDAILRGLASGPALIDVITSQDVVSSDAKKGLGFVPDYQALTVWDEAERERRKP